MAISIVGGTAVGTASSNVITKPTGVLQGDVILILCESSGSSITGFPTAPTGFTSLETNSTNGTAPTLTSVVTWAYKIAGASEPASWTFTSATGSSFDVWSCIVLRGQDATTAIDAHTSAGGTGTSLNLTALTASLAGDALVIMQTDVNDVAVSTWPTGVTENAAASNPTGNGVDTGTKLSLASGSTGTLTITVGSAPDVQQAAAFLIKAPSAGGTAWNQALTDATSARDTRTANPSKRPLDAFSSLDTTQKASSSSQFEKFSSTDALAKLPSHLLSGDAISSRDVVSLARGSLWTIVDAFSSRDSITQHNVTKALVDALSQTETTRWNTTHALAEYLVLADILTKLPSHLLRETQSALDSLVPTSLVGGVNYVQQLHDAHSAVETRLLRLTKTLTEQLAWADSTSWHVVHALIDSLSTTERLVIGKALLFTLQDWFSSTDLSQAAKQQALAAGHLAVLSLAISSLLGVSLAISTAAGLTATMRAITHLLEVVTVLQMSLQTTLTLTSPLGVTLTTT